ncbi:MAG: hypothetical protein ACK2TV_13805 [Anaerolineales bacterium]
MDTTLDSEKIEKRIDGLDRELRNDKTTIAALQSKIENLDTENSSLRIRLTDLESETTRLNALMSRQDQYALDLENFRKDIERRMEDVMSAVLEKQVQTDKNEQNIKSLNLDAIEIRKKIQEFSEYRELLNDRVQEEARLSRLIEELKAQINSMSRFDDEYKRSLHIVEENHRQDNKRLTDIQGEVAAMRKRQDELRGKQDLQSDGLRKLESRIKDLLAAESERREAQTAFIEKLNLAQVSYERTFKQWAERFESMEQITTDIEEEIRGLESLQRSVKQSQAALDDVTQRFDRRVNEITEVQRLNEDRFRQEWTTFKSDYQKRWSNYALAQEEQHREMNRDVETLMN